jgi:alpha-mannosidase
MTAIEAPTSSTGRWAGSGTLAEVTPSNVAICAIKQAEDGQGLIVRLAEIARSGAKARLAISIPGWRVRQAWVCDGAERNAGAAPVENGRVTVRLAPFEVVSIRVALEG